MTKKAVKPRKKAAKTEPEFTPQEVKTIIESGLRSARMDGVLTKLCRRGERKQALHRRKLRLPVDSEMPFTIHHDFDWKFLERASGENEFNVCECIENWHQSDLEIARTALHQGLKISVPCPREDAVRMTGFVVGFLGFKVSAQYDLKSQAVVFSTFEPADRKRFDEGEEDENLALC